MSEAQKLAAEIAKLRKRLDNLERTSQMGWRSLESGALSIQDELGNETIRLGEQADGEYRVLGTLQSDNYETGVDGWRIDVDGNAEFNDIDARGNVYVPDDTADKRVEITDNMFGLGVPGILITTPDGISAEWGPSSLILRNHTAANEGTIQLDGSGNNQTGELRVGNKLNENARYRQNEIETSDYRFGIGTRPVITAGDSTHIASVSNFTAETQVASLTIPGNLKAGNRVWFSGFLMVKQSVASDNFVIRVREDSLTGAEIMLMRCSNQSTRYEHTSFGPQWWTATDVDVLDKVFVLTVERWSGTGQIDQAGSRDEESTFTAQVELR